MPPPPSDIINFPAVVNNPKYRYYTTNSSTTSISTGTTSINYGDSSRFANTRGFTYPTATTATVSAASAASAAASPMFHDDMPLGELTEVAPLSQGGFCVICSCVYRGQRAVLKVARPRGPEGAVEDLQAEIDIYKRLSQRGGHPNIARAFGAGHHVQQGERSPFLVLERLDGGTLEEAFAQSTPVWSDPTGRLPVALEVADALVFLHNEAVPGGVILHRDLKPANIGLCGQGHVKVFDMGLSVVQEVRGDSTDTYEMSGMAGSKRFMAPEVCIGLSYNEKVDVYAFGIVLWQICALHKPYTGMTETDHYQHVVLGGMRPPLDPRWCPGLLSLLQACWHADPDCRPSIEEARDALRGVYAASGGTPCWA